jgi:hypothetical protein
MRSEGMVDFVVTGDGPFRAVLTQIALDKLRLLAIHESIARIAYMSVPVDQVLLAFPAAAGSQLWGGIRLQPNELITLAPGQDLFARTERECRWTAIWFPVQELLRYSQALSNGPSPLLDAVTVWRPTPSAGRDLRSLHSSGIRVAHALADAHAAHALEQRLIHALCNSLCGTATTAPNALLRSEHEAMRRFHKLLMAGPPQSSMASSADALHVSDRFFRHSCTHQLGMTATGYVGLRHRQSAGGGTSGMPPLVWPEEAYRKGEPECD